MLKRLMVVSVAVLALLVASVSFAQEATIAEIVVASAEGDAPEFTTLLAAVGLADPAVLEALADPEAELTVFAPTDAAFAALAEALGEEAFAAILADPEALTSILLYHVLDGAVYSEDVVALLEEYEDFVSVATLNGQYIDISADEDGIYIDDATLILDMVDIEASNGVIHVIDAVLVPETRTIAEVVVEISESEESDFNTLLGAIGLADPAILEALLDPEAELTVFAPTDAAFAALEEALGAEAFAGVLADTDALSGILLYHVVAGKIYSDDVYALLEENDGSVDVTTLLDVAATVSENEDGYLTIGDAQIILTDIDAGNGVIHVIDAVILPPTE
ncbi:MAG: fasciclin domain-containing protein [Phototrophicaceae bacterium]